MPKTKVYNLKSLFFKSLILQVLFFTLYRIIFFYIFKSSAAEFETTKVLKAFWTGLRFDLQFSAIFSFIIYILGLLMLRLCSAKTLASIIYPIIFSVYTFALIAFVSIDIGFYAYLKTHLNASALRFLEDSKDSFTMVVQTYPVIPIAIGAFILAFVIFKVFKGPNGKSYVFVKNSYLSFTLIFLTAFVLGYGKASYYPLRWSDAFFSSNSFVSAIAINPVTYFLNTFKNRKISFDKKLSKKHYKKFKELFLISDSSSQTAELNYVRDITKAERKKLNVIYIVVESLSAAKVGFMGNPLNPTPFIDKLISESYTFKNHYTPAEGTARSIFTLVTGLPDFDKVKTSSRNPLVIDQHTILNSFTDHKKYFFIGGSANWGNIRGVFGNNVPGIEIIEEGHYTEPRMDVWGLSDYSLFKEVHKKLVSKDANKAFFAVVLTSSFHRPYTIPENVPGFKKIYIDKKKLKDHSFGSLEEYNSLRFVDHSIKSFFERIQNERFFENTLVVLSGDHGLPGLAGKHLGKTEQLVDLSRFHVPLLFHNKKLFPEGAIDERLATEMDILPSVADLLGYSYRNTTLGRSVFNKAFDKSRYAFLSRYNSDGSRALLKGSSLYVTHLNSKDERYLYPSKDKVVELDTQSKEALEQKEIIEVLTETGKYMLYNNKPKK